MEITKVKLKQEGLSISYKTQKTLNNDEISYIKRTDEDDAQPHKDFLEALKALTPHLIALADQKNDKSVVATGISFTGDGDSLKAVITGKKDTESGVISLNTGSFNVYGSDYVGEEKLQKSIKTIKEESKLYIEGKAGESNQLDLFKPVEVEGEETEEEETAF